MTDKKPRSAKQLANDEKLRQMAAARKAANQNKPAEAPQEPVQPTPAPEELPPADPRDAMIATMWEEIQKLKAAQGDKKIEPEAAIATIAQMQGAQLGPNGVQGIQYRYPVDKNYYPDPTEDLYSDPRLSRMALRENFIFKWDVEGNMYEKANITYSEPRFVVELYRRMFDDETGEELGQMAFINRMYLNEDEMYARIIAEKLGTADTFESVEDMLNQIRLYRIKQWLWGIFYPPKIRTRQGSQTIIVNGKPVNIVDKEEFVEADDGKDMAGTIQRQTAL